MSLAARGGALAAQPQLAAGAPWRYGVGTGLSDGRRVTIQTKMTGSSELGNLIVLPRELIRALGKTEGQERSAKFDDPIQAWSDLAKRRDDVIHW